MKLLCYPKTRKNPAKPFVLLESDSLDDLKSKAVEYASTNPSFRHGWVSSGDSRCQELSIDFDYRLEIQF
jgi:hypothetical protein